MPQHLRRAKQAQARNQNRLSVHCFPSNVLDIIFDQAQLIEAINYDNFNISKQLLYYTLNSLYREVDLFGRHQISQFQCSLLARPRLADQVEQLRISRSKECKCCRDGSVDWTPGMKIEEREELERTRKRVEREPISYIRHPPPLEPRTLRLLFAMLPNLQAIGIYANTYMYILLDEPFLATGIFSKLRCLWLDFRKEFLEHGDRSLCRRLRDHLPSLEEFDIHGVGGGMPCGAQEEGTDVWLPHDSWKLSSFKFLDVYELEETCYDLFRSFASTLRHIVLESVGIDEDLPFYLHQLSPELESLGLRLGAITCNEEKLPTPLHPTFDHAIHHFHRLKTLEILGPIVTTTFLSTLPSFRFLEVLTLGYHIPIDGSILVDLVKDTTSLPKLKQLHVYICHCPRPGVEICQPHWTETFRWVHASKTLRAAKQRGIEIGGNLKCSIVACDRKDGHSCFRKIDSGARRTSSEES